MLVAPLLDGPLDLVGDIHGEFAALQVLLERLGYNAEGIHPAGRRLVFVGDLVDRGPQSVAVLRFVQPLLAAGLAQCLMGNHELNLLRRDRKHGNDWFFGQPSAEAVAHFGACEWLELGEQGWVEAMLEPLPLALDTRSGPREQPLYQGPLQLLAGPHRIEAGWWDTRDSAAAEARDHYLASSPGAGLLWVFRTRHAPPDARSAWFLLGFFA